MLGFSPYKDIRGRTEVDRKTKHAASSRRVVAADRFELKAPNSGESLGPGSLPNLRAETSRSCPSLKSYFLFSMFSVRSSCAAT